MALNCSKKDLVDGLSDLSLDIDGIIQSDVPQDFARYEDALKSVLERAELMRNDLETLVDNLGLNKEVYES